MLTVRKTGFFSSNYEITDGRDDRGLISVSGFSTKSQIVIDGKSFTGRRSGFCTAVYRLEQGDREFASAELSGFWAKSYAVRAGSNAWELRRTGWMRSHYVLMDRDSEVGSVARAGTWTSQIEAEFDDAIPMEVQAFVIYVVMSLYRQQAAAAAAG